MSAIERKKRQAGRSSSIGRRTQAERSHATQKLILDAAIRIMARKGTAGLRTGDVAKEAGVSIGAQLHHFPTKRSLILAAFEHVNERSTEMSVQRARFAKRAPDPETVIGAIVADASDFFFGKGFFIEMGLVFGEADQELRKVVRKSSRRSRFFVEKTWSDALEARGLPGEMAGDILALTLGIIRGFVMRRLIEDDPAKREHLIRVWADMVKAYLSSRLDADQLERIYSTSRAAEDLESRPAPIVRLRRVSSGAVRRRKKTKERPS
ncbi:TetR/AcrR family transcriptional regulator [Bradyrhizobium sp. AUGA SZCCT0240]|uniref:TetR/AcrR family transcriptional regulator n=1 Tax=Bradyrhizobium sp. AUGA SZCCT0240 TaxID=2807669 RepID=UPI001BAA6A70|nr:TetR/AcrR family transcriptional regulator [Bradyrhizobium sp. AUGA SZCCT0240]MBR1252298.1 TetR/AcrR family transcriptional regulator [Bradyrhizobium sp. AUGA SZCCT0240]